MVCPEKSGDPVTRLFHNQYTTTSGKWATDFDHKATCKTDKVEILEYCKKVSEAISAETWTASSANTEASLGPTPRRERPLWPPM